VGAQSLLRPEKKDTVVCLAGARSLLQPEKKDTVICLEGARSLLRPEKKRYSHLPGGCAIMSVFLVAIVIFVLVQLELNLIQIR
jgi:hypothetical protein